jgi:MYXO-CTERM domain-containing protein
MDVRRFLLVPPALLVALAWAAPVARAHFILSEPPSFQAQNAFGDPQKAGPCGGNGTPTGAVTRYQAGAVVHFAFQETIPHGGHYRISLGMTGQGDLPPDPPVVARDGVSISAPIQDPPQFPVLADGVNPHTSVAPGKMWTADVKLPANVTCDACLLQITQFMTDHGSNTGGNDGFFYHHCAAITIGAAAAPGADAGSGAPPDARAAADGSAPASGGGGGCSVAGGAGGGPWSLLGLLLAGGAARRRQRRPARDPGTLSRACGSSAGPSRRPRRPRG